MLQQAKTLYQILDKRKDQMGFVDFDVPETEFQVNDQGKVVSIHKRLRGHAEHMIEIFMIMANEAVGTFI